MRQLELDLLHARPRTHWLGWLLLVLGVAACAWMLWQAREVEQALAAQYLAAERLRPAVASRRAVQPSASPGQVEIQSAAAQLGLPWSELFVRLEKSGSGRIALLSLDADGRKPVLTLVAEARNFEDMLAYIETLKNRAKFRSVQLASHTLREDDPQMPVRFTLLVRWRD